MKKYAKIKGDNKPQNVIRLPRLAKIRLGVKKVSNGGKEYPAEVDYFVCPPEVKEKYGDQPKSLPVMLPVEDEGKFLRQYYACYGGNQKLKCQGDGEDASRRTDDGIEEIMCPAPENCEFGIKNKCAARTDFMFILPDINCGGTYQLSTGSINSDIDIRSGIEMAKHLFGRISWVPMQLVREEMKIADPGSGKMQTHWPVKLYPTATVAEANMIRGNSKRILDRQAMIALEEPVIEGVMEDTPKELETDEDVIDVTSEEVPFITIPELLKKINSTTALPHLQNVWKKYQPALKKMPKADVEMLTTAKEAQKDALSGGIQNQEKSCTQDPNTCDTELRIGKAIGCNLEGGEYYNNDCPYKEKRKS